MTDKINSVRNPDFSEGKIKPNGWTWTASVSTAGWCREAKTQPAGSGGVRIDCPDEITSQAAWTQTLTCKPEQYYRVEATVSCDLEAKDETCGLVLSVEPVEGTESAGERRVTPGLHRSSKPVSIRTYYKVPKGVRRVRLSVGLEGARGTAFIEHVRFILMLEPEEMSHAIAIPPPAFAVAPPKVCSRVCVCSGDASARPITRLLRGFFGEQFVDAIEPGRLRPANLRADALLLPDSVLPRSVRSLSSLIKLAYDRIVVISLPAFEKLSGGNATVRRIEQDDDPIHAKVSYANFATRGFALNDAFPFAWEGSTVGSLVQNQFRSTRAFKEFCGKHGFVALLLSLCDKDSTSDKPVCLYKPTRRGGLFVLDVDPVESWGSTFSEPALAMHLLLSVLGREQAALGQYVVPHTTEKRIRGLIRDAGDIFPEFVVHDEDVPIEEVTEQLVTIGHLEDRSYGLPLKPKPVILVRSGLASGDVESVYACLLWFKQLIRTEPFRCPYAMHLAHRFRLAWVPVVAPWGSREGFRRTSLPPACPMSIESEDAAITTVIDVVSRPTNAARVVMASDSQEHRRYRAWLPRLMAAFKPGGYFLPAVADGEGFTDRDSIAWRRVRHEVRVEVDPAEFDSDFHRRIVSDGGKVLRIEVPGCDADFVAHSIQRTDLTATMLEQVIGLQTGLIAVNRSATTVNFDAFPPVPTGETLIVDESDPMLQSAMQAG